MNTKPALIDWITLLCLGVIWGASFMGSTVALGSFAPLHIVTIRIAIGAFVIWCFAQWMGVGLPDRHSAKGRRIWLHCFGFAVFTAALPFSLLSWAQQHISSGFAGIAMASGPLFTLPLARVFLGEAMTAQKIIGILIGFVGVGVLIGPAIFSRTGSELEGVAQLACVGAALSYTIGAVITRTAPQGPLLSYSTGGLLIATLMIVPIALFAEPLPRNPQLAPILGVLYLGIFPTALATVLLVKVVNSAGPTFVSLVNYQVPIWAVVFGTVFLAESLPPSFIAALALILLGLGISQARGGRFRP